MNIQFALTGALFCMLGIVFGAFGAHGLESRVSAEDLLIFETGVRYQMYHGLGLLALSTLVRDWKHRLLNKVFQLFVFGVVIFSGSLYLLVLLQWRFMGAVTPLGGLALILAWAGVIYMIVKGKDA